MERAASFSSKIYKHIQSIMRLDYILGRITQLKSAKETATYEATEEETEHHVEDYNLYNSNDRIVTLIRFGRQCGPSCCRCRRRS